MNTEQIKERIKLNSDLFKILVAFDLLGISAIATRTITNGADLTASVGYIYVLIFSVLLFVYFKFILTLIHKIK